MSSLTTRDITYTALFAGLIAGGAFVTVPVGPVPFTLQVLFVLLAGMALGPRLGALSVLAYLAIGLVAPVYAGASSGVGVLFGPTGGYLWGFVPAAVVTGLIATRGKVSLLRYVLAGVTGLVPIYVLGALWLSAQLHLDARAAFAAGVAPFVWLDVVKAVVAGVVARGLVNLPLGLPALQRDR